MNGPWEDVSSDIGDDVAFPVVKEYDPLEFHRPVVDMGRLHNMAFAQIAVAAMLLFFQVRHAWGGYMYLNFAMASLMFLTWRAFHGG